jgi:hypothetical protein
VGHATFNAAAPHYDGRKVNKSPGIMPQAMPSVRPEEVGFSSRLADLFTVLTYQALTNS